MNKYRRIPIDPMIEIRARFVRGAERQIKRLELFRIEPSTRDWFELGDERKDWRGPKCTAWLCNGTKIIPLSSEGNTHMEFDSRWAAADFYRGAIHACKAGELDELLIAASAKVRRA